MYPPKYASPATHRGATLIEVLVSVAVTSVGLLGMAGLMAVSAKVNYGAYQRTQTGFIAQALIDSMHVNPSAVAQGRYDGTYSGTPVKAPDCRKQACSTLQRADYDKAQFHSELRTALPNASASLKCNPAVNAPSSASDAFDGVCRLQVDWSERALTQTAKATPQSLVWVFQP